MKKTVVIAFIVLLFFVWIIIAHGISIKNERELQLEKQKKVTDYKTYMRNTNKTFLDLTLVVCWCEAFPDGMPGTNDPENALLYEEPTETEWNRYIRDREDMLSKCAPETIAKQLNSIPSTGYADDYNDLICLAAECRKFINRNTPYKKENTPGLRYRSVVLYTAPENTWDHEWYCSSVNDSEQTNLVISLKNVAIGMNNHRIYAFSN